MNVSIVVRKLQRYLPCCFGKQDKGVSKKDDKKSKGGKEADKKSYLNDDRFKRELVKRNERFLSKSEILEKKKSRQKVSSEPNMRAKSYHVDIKPEQKSGKISDEQTEPVVTEMPDLYDGKRLELMESLIEKIVMKKAKGSTKSFSKTSSRIVPRERHAEEWTSEVSSSGKWRS